MLRYLQAFDGVSSLRPPRAAMLPISRTIPRRKIASENATHLREPELVSHARWHQCFETLTPCYSHQLFLQALSIQNRVAVLRLCKRSSVNVAIGLTCCDIVAWRCHCMASDLPFVNNDVYQEPAAWFGWEYVVAHRRAVLSTLRIRVGCQLQARGYGCWKEARNITHTCLIPLSTTHALAKFRVRDYSVC
jgi:hypothetical protein